jgi:hypothetical protein
MSLADACLVRMSETLPDAVILTTGADFRIYRSIAVTADRSSLQDTGAIS